MSQSSLMALIDAFLQDPEVRTRRDRREVRRTVAARAGART
jgi:hypothetical protein